MGEGKRERTRVCSGGNDCDGDSTESKICVGSTNCPDYIPPAGCECVSADKRFTNDKFVGCAKSPIDQEFKCYVEKPCLTSIVNEPHFVSCIDTKKVAGTNSGKKSFDDYIAISEGSCPKGSKRIEFTSECKTALQFIAGYESKTNFRTSNDLEKPTGCSYNLQGDQWLVNYNHNQKSIKVASPSELVICAIV